MSKQDRPLGVSVLAILWALSMVLWLILASEMWHGRLGTLRISQSFSNSLPQRAPFAVVFGLISGIIAFGMWDLQNWARMVTIGISVLDLIRTGLALFIVSVWINPFMHLGNLGILFLVASVTINLIIIVYLRRPAVTKAFKEAW